MTIRLAVRSAAIVTEAALTAALGVVVLTVFSSTVPNCTASSMLDARAITIARAATSPVRALNSAISGVGAPQETMLVDRYRAGPITLRDDEDWTPNLPPDLVFESRGDIAVAPDGSVFVSNTTRHTIYKFDPAGRFVKAFGQQGQGPGDLTHPGRLSILDGRYLVVGEYATNQRLSLFDLDGGFVQVVSTGRFTSKAIAFGNGKIAYVSISGRMEPNEMINRAEVRVVDRQGGAQKSIVTHEFRQPVTRTPGGGITLSGTAGVLLARTLDGGLVVGTTQSPRLDIFTAEGVKVRTIDTGWTAVPVTAKYKDGYFDRMHKHAEAEGRTPPSKMPPLPDVLDILQDVWTDDQGNILVCRKTDCLEGCPLQFKIYSPAGDFQCDFELRPGPFVLSADFRFKRIVVTGRGIYGLLERADDPDGYLHLVRMRFSSTAPPIHFAAAGTTRKRTGSSSSSSFSGARQINPPLAKHRRRKR